MRYKLGFIFAIFFAAFCTCQEIKPAAAQTGPAQTVTTQSAVEISGTVLQSDMQSPLKNVQVSATRGARPEASDESEDGSAADRKFSTKTDEKGHFEFADLLPGTYYVRASHVGMVMKSPLGREGMLVTLEAGKPQTLNLVMLPGAVITGCVLNEDGEPMQHVEVGALRYIYTIRGRTLAHTGSNAETDDKGEYRLFGLQPGSYLIAADPGRMAYAEGTGVAALTSGRATALQYFFPLALISVVIWASSRSIISVRARRARSVLPCSMAFHKSLSAAPTPNTSLLRARRIWPLVISVRLPR
jgi:hypothetical protein